MYLQHGPNRKYIFIDVDCTPIATYGRQEKVAFNGHYNCNCYLPLLAFVDGFPIGVFIASGTLDGRKTLMPRFRSLVERLTERRPHSVITLRADSGFNSTSLIDACEELGIHYIIGLSPNPKLNHYLDETEPQFMDVLPRSLIQGGDLLRQYGEIAEYRVTT